jgi:hypothetical protein
MTEVLAGLVGGLLALAGGFLVQWGANRHDDRSQGRRLAAQFLTATHTLEFTIEASREHKSRQEQIALAMQVLAFQTNMTNVGHELELLSDRKTAALVRRTVNAAMQCLNAGADRDDGPLREHLKTFDAEVDELETRIVSKLGRWRAKA